MDRVRVVEARHVEPALQALHQIGARCRPRGHLGVDREGAPRVGGRQPVAGGTAAGARRRGAVPDNVPADARVHQRHRLAADAFVVERRGQAGRVTGVVANGDELAPDSPPRLEEGAPLLDRQRAEAQVSQHVQDVHHRVLGEHDRVVARLERDGPYGPPGCLGCLAAQRRRVDQGGVDRGRLRVAGAILRTHGDRDELAGGPRLGRPDPARARHGDGLHACRERAVGGDAGRVGSRDHRPNTRGAQLRGRRGRAVGKRAADGADRAGFGQARPVGCLLHQVADPPGRLRQPEEGVGVGSPGGRDGNSLAAHEAEVDPDVRLGHVLVDLRVGEARERGILGHHEDLGLGRPGRLGMAEDDLRDREAFRRRAAVPRLHRAHFMTPTWTLRNRAPEQACPTWPVCGGSPLPQFGVPSIT